MWHALGCKSTGLVIPGLRNTLTRNSLYLSCLTPVALPPAASYSDQAPTASVQATASDLCDLLTQGPPTFSPVANHPAPRPLNWLWSSVFLEHSLCLYPFPLTMLTPAHSSDPSSNDHFRDNSPQTLEYINFFGFHHWHFILIWGLSHGSLFHPLYDNCMGTRIAFLLLTCV